MDLKIDNYTHVMSSCGTLSNMQFSQFSNMLSTMKISPKLDKRFESCLRSIFV